MIRIVLTVLSIVFAFCACASSGRSAPAVPMQDPAPVAQYQEQDKAPVQVAQADLGPGGAVKTGKPYVIKGVTYYPLQSLPDDYEEVGIASWYGKDFHGKATANGETYDMYAMTAAHKTLPLPTYVQVTNLENGKETVVRVNDRGPFSKGRIIDLSYAAAKELGMVDSGTAKVKVSVLSQSPSALKTDGISEDMEAGNFAVQIGSFSNRDNAEKVAANYSNSYVSSASVGGKTVYRVQVRGYKTQHEAEAAADKLSKSHPGAFVIRL